MADNLPKEPKWPQSDRTLYTVRIGETTYPPKAPSGGEFVTRPAEASELGVSDWNSTSTYVTEDRARALQLAESYARQKHREVWVMAEPSLGEVQARTIAHYDHEH